MNVITDLPHELLDLIVKKVNKRTLFPFILLFVSKKFNRICKSNNIKIYTNAKQYDQLVSHDSISISYCAAMTRLPNIALWAVTNKFGPTEFCKLIPLLIIYKSTNELTTILVERKHLIGFTLRYILNQNNYYMFNCLFNKSVVLNNNDINNICCFVFIHSNTDYLDTIIEYLTSSDIEFLIRYNNKKINEWLALHKLKFKLAECKQVVNS